MNRTETIYELAKYCHQDWYKSILSWPTWALKGLLDYYLQEEKEYIALKELRAGQVVVIGIDFARGEPLKNKLRFDDMRPKK